MGNKTSERKLDHINLCLEEDVEARFKTTGFEDIDLIHQTSPGIDLDDINLGSELFGKNLEAPILICPITGGHKRGKEINLALAEAAQELGIAFSVGSQRAAIENPDLEETYKVRDVAPDILLFSNLGVTQLNEGYGIEEAEKAVEMIDADGLGLHFNSLQEAVQPEGNTNFKEVLERISDIASKLEEPIYVKETGAGIKGSVGAELAKTGVKAIDVSGAGGTSWAGVEALREESNVKLGDVFWDWGIPTSASTTVVSENVDIPIISSGGIRSGLDAAKAMALGADFVGIGLPLFRASVQGKEKVVNWLEEFTKELKIAMFLSGCVNIDELQSAPLKISGRAQEWFTSLGLDPEKYEDRT